MEKVSTQNFWDEWKIAYYIITFSFYLYNKIFKHTLMGFIKPCVEIRFIEKKIKKFKNNERKCDYLSGYWIYFLDASKLNLFLFSAAIQC